MKINNIKVNGLKGLTFAASHLGSIVKIKGANRSGKTTLIDAITIASMGRLPSVAPKENTRTQSLMRALGPDNWSIELETTLGPASYKVTPSLIVHESKIPVINPAIAEAFIGSSKPEKIKTVMAASDLSSFDKDWADLRATAPKTITVEGDNLFDQACSMDASAKQRQKALKQTAASLPLAIAPLQPRPEQEATKKATQELAQLKTQATQKTQTLRAHEALLQAMKSLSSGISSGEYEARAKGAKAHLDASESEIASIDSQMAKLRIKMSTIGPARVVPAQPEPGTKCLHCGSTSEHWDIAEVDEAAIHEYNRQTASSREACKEGIASLNRAKFTVIGDLDRNREEFYALKGAHDQALSAETAKAKAEANKPSFDISDIEELEAQAEQIESITQAYTMLDQEWDRYEQLASESQMMAKELNDLAETIKGIKSFSADLVRGIFSSILEVGNRLTQAAIGIKFEWQKDQVAIVRADGGLTASATMSGSERALLDLTLSFGLQVRSGAKTILLDESGILDPIALTGLMTALEEAVSSGLIDQAFVVSPTGGPLDCE